MITVTHTAAALAGLLSFLSPCVLPMVPFYLSWMAGRRIDEMCTSMALIWRAFAFSLGVMVIFVLLGTGASFAGRLLAQWYDPLSWIAGAGLGVMGLHSLGVVSIPLLSRQAATSARPDPITLTGAFLTGLAFGFAWTPCVGPVLASILLLASGTGDSTLLISYGIGMTAPFVVTAVFLGPSLAWLSRHRMYFAALQRVTGGAMVLFGILLATGGIRAIALWMLDQLDWSAMLANVPTAFA
ncbi:cytochrome c biogenesis CcdA family protein [Paracoccus sp. JM45]|uniref:cytochrome c biogenesis CcdA family protein n=1 Tax=Paracoccus sp. JM45 TaxID=2283626 RepID=UPI000E6C343D|nr:cytochrome c biogenesis CcdA family protein [Paracoccus sp. JM45]RJE78807.1 cytochrome c biogenesis protein CcdA [Paracoccus sp. JM45]